MKSVSVGENFSGLFWKGATEGPPPARLRLGKCDKESRPHKRAVALSVEMGRSYSSLIPCFWRKENRGHSTPNFGRRRFRRRHKNLLMFYDRQCHGLAENLSNNKVGQEILSRGGSSNDCRIGGQADRMLP